MKYIYTLFQQWHTVKAIITKALTAPIEIPVATSATASEATIPNDTGQHSLQQYSKLQQSRQC